MKETYQEKSKKFNGHTLDFYNENLSLKAVSKLIESVDTDTEEEDSEIYSTDKNVSTIKDSYESVNTENLTRVLLNKKSEKTLERKSKPIISTKNYNRRINSFLLGFTFILLVILVYLVHELVSIKLTNEEVAAEDLNILQLKNNDLMEEIIRLQLENENLTRDLETVENISNHTEEEVLEDNIPSSIDTQNNIPANSKYTVQAGDNLTKISKKFYDTESEVDKIKEANNMVTDDIFVGASIIIPQ